MESAVASLVRSDFMPLGMLDMSRGRRSGLTMAFGAAVASGENVRARVRAMVVRNCILRGDFLKNLLVY